MARGEQEDDRQRREQDVESDLVRGLLAAWRPPTMRDHPVEEGLARVGARCATMSQSERTCVPPGHGAAIAAALADDRGALSPVMALSLTEAVPSRTSPSAGMRFARFDQDLVPLAERARSPLRWRVQGVRRGSAETSWPCTSLRAVRRVSAWALPRPSAMASAKLANEHGEPEPRRDRQDEPGDSFPAGRASAACRYRPVVDPLPTSRTVNMTGICGADAARVQLD